MNQTEYTLDEKGYAVDKYGRRLHVQVWKEHNGAIPPGMQIDHIDRNRANFDISNLRLVTPQQNSYNSHVTGGSSDYKGVRWMIREQMWRAHIKYHNGTKRERVILGFFNTEEEAARAYKAAVPTYHGEYGYLNQL